MKQLIKRWFSVAFVLLGLISCRKDALVEPPVRSLVQEDSVTLLLSAEIGFEEDEGDLKGLTFKLEDAGNGRPIPRPQLADGEEVEVHTLIRSSDGIVGAKTLKWRYDGAKKRLVLKVSTDPGQNISVPKFNNDSGRTWQMAAMLAPGTTLEGTQVSIQGNRNLRFVRGDIGDDLGDLNVPYWTDWVEVKVHSAGSRDGDDSYSEGYVPSSDFKFKPLGSIFAFSFYNAIHFGGLFSNVSSSDTDFSFGDRFTVSTGLFFDKGRFDLLAGRFYLDEDPLFTQSGTSSIVYTCDGTPEAVGYGSNLKGVYYAWGMPRSEDRGWGSKLHRWVSVVVEGTTPNISAARGLNVFTTANNYLDHDYLEQGRIYRIRRAILHPVVLPIDWFAEYNLAGNFGGYPPLELQFPQPYEFEGIKGPLRWARYDKSMGFNPTPHHNDESGYYYHYQILGTQDSDGRYYGSLRGSSVSSPSDMYNTGIQIPTAEDWEGVLISSKSRAQVRIRVLGQDPVEFLEYSTQAFYRLTSEGPVSEQYAIRMLPIASSHLGSTRFARDCAYKSAYRYTFVGFDPSVGFRQQNLTNHLKVDVIYLGATDFKQEGKTELETISNPEWWDSGYRQAGLSYRTSRIFPLPGQMLSVGIPNGVNTVGYYAMLSHEHHTSQTLSSHALIPCVTLSPGWGFFNATSARELISVRSLKQFPYEKEYKD